MAKNTPRKSDIVPSTPVPASEEGRESAEKLFLSYGLTLSDSGSVPKLSDPPAWDWSKLPVSSDRYEILSPLAQGGMGTLFIAHDRLLGRKVALKALHAEYLQEPQAILRFFQEARIHAQLHHSGIPTLHDVGRLFDSRPFIAMTYVEGGTLLDQLVDRESPADDLGHHLAVFEQVCKIVAYAHAKGVIHRDLTPANVLISTRGQVQLVDWGLAKVVKRPTATEMAGAVKPDTAQIDIGNLSKTDEGVALGTPAFIPPEQAKGRPDAVDQRSDVFGLGALLCHILTGSPPYTGNLSSVREQAKTGDLTPALARLDACPASAEWVELAKHCLAVESSERPLNAAEVSARVIKLRSVAARKAVPWWKRLFREDWAS